MHAEVAPGRTQGVLLRHPGRRVRPHAREKRLARLARPDAALVEQLGDLPETVVAVMVTGLLSSPKRLPRGLEDARALRRLAVVVVPAVPCGRRGVAGPQLRAHLGRRPGAGVASEPRQLEIRRGRLSRGVVLRLRGQRAGAGGRDAALRPPLRLGVRRQAAESARHEPQAAAHQQQRRRHRPQRPRVARRELRRSFGGGAQRRRPP
mmetsp:Transcript_104079/g.271765  ORF Transcript_104079/g.271765 Transcript_104079/m.271765 type:complete len:207 (-) Transcript_104079:955-1575(-)